MPTTLKERPMSEQLALANKPPLQNYFTSAISNCIRLFLLTSQNSPHCVTMAGLQKTENFLPPLNLFDNFLKQYFLACGFMH